MLDGATVLYRANKPKITNQIKSQKFINDHNSTYRYVKQAKQRKFLHMFMVANFWLNFAVL